MNALKLYYLGIYLGLGAVLPLLAIAMEARGFQPTQYRWLLALLPLSRLLSPPLWGVIADKWLGTSLLLRVNTWFAALAMLLLTHPLGFSGTLATFAFWALFSSSLVPLVEAGTYHLLAEKAANFGYVRVFGSIGFAVSAVGMGVIGVDDTVRTPFLAAALAYGIAGVLAQRLPNSGGLARKPLFAAVGTLLAKPDVLLLWLASVLYYAAHGAFDVYFGPHVTRLPGVAKEAVSFGWGISVICEVAMLFCVPALLRRFQARTMLWFSALVAALRWYLLAHATTTLHIWLLAPLHAITFGLWYLSFVHDNQEGAPVELRATVQGLAAACLGLGMITATMTGGFLLEHWGGRVLFQVASVSATLSFFVYAARAFLHGRGRRVLAAPLSEP